MKKILKNASLIALGLFMGLTISSGADQPSIQAKIDNITSIYVKGSQVNIPSENMPLNYKNRLYIPLRLISENMGFDVNYEKSSKSVYITEKPLTKEEKLARDAKIYEEAKAELKALESKTVEDARKEDIPKKNDINYRQLPISFKQDKFIMTLKMVVEENANYNSEFYFDVKNEGEKGMVIDPFSAKFDYSDEKAERQLDLSDVSVNHMDIRALSSLDSGYDDAIYLTLNKIPKGIKQGTLSFNAYPVGEDTNITKVIMPIKLD